MLPRLVKNITPLAIILCLFAAHLLVWREAKQYYNPHSASVFILLWSGFLAFSLYKLERNPINAEMFLVKNLTPYLVAAIPFFTGLWNQSTRLSIFPWNPPSGPFDMPYIPPQPFFGFEPFMIYGALVILAAVRTLPDSLADDETSILRGTLHQ